MDPTQQTPATDPKVIAAKEDQDKLTEKPTESMGDVVEEFEEQQKDFQAMYNAGGTFKQKLEQVVGGMRRGGAEAEPSSAEAGAGKAPEAVVEIPTEPEVDKKLEQEGYIEKVEKQEEITNKPIVDDYTQAVLLKSTDPQNTKVILPLTAAEEETGLKMAVWDSLRWMAEWCLRQMKMLKGRAEYKAQENSGNTVGIQ
jgi:hypothetical protein